MCAPLRPLTLAAASSARRSPSVARLHVPQHRNTAMALQVLAGKIEDMMMKVAINRAAAEAAEKAQG